MRRAILILAVIILALAAIPASAQICTEIPATMERDIRLATYNVMHAVLVESPATPYHDARLQLATYIANNPIGSNPGEWWRIIIEYRQAQVAGCQVNWVGLSWAQLCTNLSDAWTEVARLRFDGEE